VQRTLFRSRHRRWAVRLFAAIALALAGNASLGLSVASALPSAFATEGPAAGQISDQARGIAIEQESGDVYVADRDNERIDKFGPEGQFLLAWGWGVADGSTEALQTCTTTCFKGFGGEFFKGSGAGEFSGAEGIAVDNDPLSASHGDVYVVDSGNHRVQKFGPEGEFILMLGGEVNAGTKEDLCLAGEECQAGVAGTGPGEFEVLTGRAIAVGAGGAVYVGDENRVQRFSAAGVLGSEIPLPGVGRVENLAVDSAGNVYIQSNERTGVRKYDATGAELGSPRDEAGFGGALTITIGPADELLLNDLQERHHVLAFNAAGEQSASFDVGGDVEDGHRGIAYSENTKALYVLNAGRVRIVTQPPPGPFILSGSETASEIQQTSATLGAMINPEGAASEYHFEYGTTTAYGESTPISASLNAVNEVQSVTVAATGGGFTLAFKGEPSVEIPFSATAAEMQAALEGVPGLGAGQVAVGGEPGGPWSVEFTGARAGENVPELSADPEHLTGPGPEPSAAVATTTPGFSLFDDRAASAAIKELQPSTTYHFRVVATNGSQTTFGLDETFTTLPPVSIEGTSALQVNATSARLQAQLNPHGVASTYHFEYGTSTAYGTSVPIPDGSVGAGTSESTVSNLIQDLLPSTTYHYRVVAGNELGSVQGPDRSLTTQGAASILPDGRDWELVSPQNKHGSPLEPITEEGGVIQAAAGGGGLAYVALGPVNGEPKGVRSPTDSQLLSTRSPDGWSTQDITTPHEEITIIHAGFPSEYRVFSEDLSASIVEPEGATPLSAQTTERTAYRREADGEFVPLVTAANVPAGTKFASEVQFRTSTPNLSHTLLVSSQVLAGGFEAGFEPEGAPSLYELSGGSLELVSVLPSGEASAEAGMTAGVGRNDLNMRGAISSDGNRVVFETETNGTKAHLYLRDVGLGQTVQLDELQPGAAGGQGKVAFQAASSDGNRVFFTDASRLSADATARFGQPDLYMCEIKASAGHLTCALTDLSVDHNAGEAANVQGEVSAIDAGGSHVYFAANGVLTSAPNAQGEHAVPGVCNSAGEAACNLYEYDTNTRQISLVAVLSSHDDPDWAGSTNVHVLGNLTARSSPDGRYLTFMSQRSLTGYDNRDARSGEADAEVYLFDSASGKLGCVSCDPSGARPQGVFDPPRETFPGLLVDRPRSWRERWLAGSVPGWTLGPSNEVALYQSRYLSNSGRTFFNAADALVPQDTNNVEDVYQYEPAGIGDCTSSSSTFSSSSAGCVNLISSGSSKEESAFLDASESGDEAFFLTASRLTPSDVDGALDVYDAHICSASSPCPPAPPPPAPACEGDACQSPSAPPNDATPGSLTYKGPGNASPPPPAKVKARPLTKAQLLARALKACKAKKPKHKRLSCEKQARKRYAAKKSAKANKRAKAKKATHPQGGGR
jgi:hypothetical protein